ncbi:MAG: hypothetical protein U0Q18_16365 [Bryobacteraceae bacterium]
MTRKTRLWLALLTGPTIWFFSMLANFALSPWACAFGWKPALFIVTIIALAITAASGFFSWTLWKQVGVEMPGEGAGSIADQRSLALAGILLNSMFVLVIVAQSVPNIILGACE